MSAASSSAYLPTDRDDRDDASSSWVGLAYALAALVLVASLAGLSGCAPTLVAQSAAPPGREARLDPVKGFWGDVKFYRLEISQGVAIAMTCDNSGPCRGMALTSDDPTVAEVKRASLGTLVPSAMGPYATGHAIQGQQQMYGYGANQATAAGLVVVGKRAGTTRIRVAVGKETREIRVTVVPPPPQSPAAAIAK